MKKSSRAILKGISHKLFHIRRRILLELLFIFVSTQAFAQMDSLLFERNYVIDAQHTNELGIEIDNVSFFKDNEYSGALITGYTLPGLWIQPKVTYQPLNNLKMELGFHSLIYAGKMKYPNVGYHDIGTWKGSDYMESTHLLPFFRANIQLGKVHFVLGDIYGGQNHHLIEPLHSRELNLTNDPEMGLQALIDIRHWHLDVWINWMSFIFKNDTHQESFIFGGNSEVKCGRWTFPVQAVVQHRGGEIQAAPYHGVQTLINAAAGARYELPIRTNWLNKLTAEAEGTYYLQQSGELFSINNGWGAYLRTMFDFTPGIRFDLNYFHGRKYIPILGDGHFSCFNPEESSITFNNTNIISGAIEYSKTFAKHYAFGARAEMYNMMLGSGSKMDFNFGVFIKCNPHFLIKKFDR